MRQAYHASENNALTLPRAGIGGVEATSSMYKRLSGWRRPAAAVEYLLALI